MVVFSSVHNSPYTLPSPLPTIPSYFFGSMLIPRFFLIVFTCSSFLGLLHGTGLAVHNMGILFLVSFRNVSHAGGAGVYLPFWADRPLAASRL